MQKWIQIAVFAAAFGGSYALHAQQDLAPVTPTTSIGKLLAEARSGRCTSYPQNLNNRQIAQRPSGDSYLSSPVRKSPNQTKRPLLQLPTAIPATNGFPKNLALIQSQLSSGSQVDLEEEPSPSDLKFEAIPSPAQPQIQESNEPAFTAPDRLPPEPSAPVMQNDVGSAANKPVAEVESNFTPPAPETWWVQHVVRPLQISRSATPITIDSLLVDALRHSAKVQAISDNSIIAQSSIVRAEAEFDVHAFMESKFVRTSVPTGSTLEAGFNVPRLREEDWFVSGGLRRKNLRGGQFEVSQRNGLKASNSQFFVPSQQANSRLTLGYKQPLLNGSGEAFNSSLIVLAAIDTRIAANRSTAELQEHLLAVTDAAWELYFQRTLLLQKKRHLANAEVILEKLESRRELDALESQIARARSAVAMRKAELIRAVTAIRNAESRVRALVNSPAMLSNRTAELVPTEPPTSAFIPVSLQDAVLTAMENRPEINSATQEIEAARVRLNVAKNELMPMLDLVVETYVSGLQGNFGVGQSFVDQFSTGEPAYTAGLVFEVPLQRRAAKANFQKRRVELRQLSRRLQTAIETLHADVEVAVREVETTHRELHARQQAMKASLADVRYQQRRWEELAGDDRSASFLLADLLDAQSRLVFEERGVSRAQVDYALSLVRLRRATGTLLKHEKIELVRTIDNGLPAIHFEKQ